MKNQVFKEKLNNFSRKFLCIFLCATMGYIGINSLLSTTIIDTKVDVDMEKIKYFGDNILLNILFLIMFIALGYLLYIKREKIYPYITKKRLCVLVFVVTVIVGIVWVYTVQSVPAADSGKVFIAAQDAAESVMDEFHVSNVVFDRSHNYFNYYPFQLGFVFICECVYRVVGGDTPFPVDIVNVIALALMYVALINIASLITRKKGVITLLAVFLLSGIQPVLFTCFHYGNLIGFSACIWACYFAMKFVKKPALGNVVGLILCMTLGVIAKYNSLICVVAIAIYISVAVITSNQKDVKEWKKLIIIPFVVLVPLLTLHGIVSSYEARSGCNYGSGISQKVYLNMGIGESKLGPGWYDANKSIHLFAEKRMDVKAIDKESEKQIKKRLNELSKNKSYAIRFFNKKLLSQWNEPEFESIWVSEVKMHYNGDIVEGDFLDSFYNGGVRSALHRYMDWMHMAMFLCCAIGMLVLYSKKSGSDIIVLMLFLVGAFIYHMIFEAKSQYILVYYILVEFFAVFGFYGVARGLDSLGRKIRKPKKDK